MVDSHLLLLLALCLVLALLSPAFLTPGNALNVLRQASLLIMLALAQMLAILTGGIDLSNGSVVALSSCVGAVVMRDHGLVPGVATALAVGMACGAANGLMVAKVGLPPFIATFGTMLAYRGLALLYMGGRVITGFSPEFRFLGAGHIMTVPTAILIALLLALLFYLTLNHTTLGRAIYAVGANRRAALYAGINVARNLLLAYTISGMVSASVGLVFVARLDAAEPLIGDSFNLDSIAATVVGGTSLDGGIGTVRGTVLGGLIMTVIMNGLNLLGVSSYWQAFVTGAVIVLAILANTWVGRRG